MNALLASVTDVVTKNVSTLGKDILGGAKSVIKKGGRSAERASLIRSFGAESAEVHLVHDIQTSIK